MSEEAVILDQARRQIIRVLSQLEAYSVPPTAPAPSGEMARAEFAECESRLEKAAAASRALLLDIAAALDKVQGASPGPDL